MKRTYSNVEVIDLTFSSDDESEYFIACSANELFVREEVTSDVLLVEDHVVHVSTPIPKIPKIKKVCTDVTLDSSCVITPSIDVNEGVSTGCDLVFKRLPNRFYCYCNKTQIKHRHEKLLAMRGLTSNRRMYWTCRVRSLSAISGCSFFTWDPITRTLD